MSRWRLSHLVFFVAVALLLPRLVGAQALATLNGRLVDSTGGVLPGVSVTATAAATGVTRSTVTNGEGFYTIPALEPGIYEVRSELDGFATTVRSEVRLSVGSTTTVDLTMAPAGLQETATVTAEAPLIDITTSEHKSVIDNEEIQQLPLLGRNFTSLVLLVPGARAGNTKFPTQATQGSMSFGGANSNGGGSSGLTVDGGDNQDHGVRIVAVNYTLESIEEFKVSTNQFSASEGGTLGASISILTKSGSNNLRGSGFYFGKDDSLTSKDYFTEQAGRDKIPYSRHQVGGSLGGPLKTNRAFFFGAVEHIKENQSLATPERALNELRLLIPYGANPVEVREMPSKNTMYFGKVSGQVGSHSMFARVGGQYVVAENNQGVQATGQNVRDLLETDDKTKSVSVLVSDGWVISPRLLNQLTIQDLHWLSEQSARRRPPAVENLVFPSVTQGYEGLFTYQLNHQHTLQVRDELTMQVGGHSLNAGGSYMLDLYGPGGIYAPYEQGSFTFFDDPSVILSDTVKYPQGFQTPGAVRLYLQGPAAQMEPIENLWQGSWWVQDDWRVTDNLTLNMGLRWDLWHWIVSDFEKYSRPFQVLQAIDHPFGRALPKNDTNDFAPRIGAAYQMNEGRTVVRGGWGLYYDQYGITYHFFHFALSKPHIFGLKVLNNTSVGQGNLADYRFLIDPPPDLLLAEDVTDFPPGSRSNANWMSPDYHDQYSHQAHIGVSHALTPEIALSADYTATLQRDVSMDQQINPIINGRRLLEPALEAAYGDPYRVGAFAVKVNAGHGRYDQFTTRLDARGSFGNVQVSYTLSSAKTCGGTVFGATNNQQWDVLCADSDYGYSATDERHKLVLAGAFLVPGGFQLAPVFQAASARPYTLTAGVDTNADGTFNDRYVDPATGVLVPPFSERGDPFYLMDLRVTKAFNFATSQRLEVFLEMFNLFNTANFGSNYIGNSRSPLFKQPVGLMIDVGYPRQAQLGARFSF